MTWQSGRGRPVPPQDDILTHWVYFVAVCSFTFEFHSLEQVRTCLDYFRGKIHPSSMEPGVTQEHYWQPWQQRLPLRLFEEAKRKRVVHALERALSDFVAGKGERA